MIYLLLLIMLTVSSLFADKTRPNKVWGDLKQCIENGDCIPADEKTALENGFVLKKIAKEIRPNDKETYFYGNHECEKDNYPDKSELYELKNTKNKNRLVFAKVFFNDRQETKYILLGMSLWNYWRPKSFLVAVEEAKDLDENYKKIARLKEIQACLKGLQDINELYELFEDQAKKEDALIWSGQCPRFETDYFWITRKQDKNKFLEVELDIQDLLSKFEKQK